MTTVTHYVKELDPDRTAAGLVELYHSAMGPI